MFRKKTASERSVSGAWAWSILKCFVFFISLAGCGASSRPHTVAVVGVVTMKGQPLSAGQIVFVPTDVNVGHSAIGNIGAGGEYVLGTFDAGDGAIPGTYKVAIVSFLVSQSVSVSTTPAGRAAPAVQPPAIPVRYFDVRTSELSAVVKDSPHRLNFDLSP